jgi:copper chaperone NosL
VKAPLLLAVLLLSCERTDVAEDPAWGKQACAACSMLVSQPRFAAELVTARGDKLYFDDPGCMAAYIDQHPGKPLHRWVRGREHWFDADAARFSAGAQTPMDYGFEVTADGRIDWSTLRERVRVRTAERSAP